MWLISQVQQAPPQERLRGIQDRFNQGGSAAEMLLVIGVIFGAFVLMYIAVRLGNRRARHKQTNPQDLFGEMIAGLSLTASQRDLLERIARELHLPNPTSMLISPRTFQRYADQWMRQAHSIGPVMQRRIDEVSRLVFSPKSQQPARTTHRALR